MSKNATIWQRYEIDPLDLIGKSVRLTIVTNEARKDEEPWGNGHFHFGTVEYIHEHRGRVVLEELDSNWAENALESVFDQQYPSVTVGFRGGKVVTFDPECDAASFSWA